MPATRPSILSKSTHSMGFHLWFRFVERKSPLASVAGGLQVSFDLSGRLHQAMAVRRHGGSMMVVVTVMAVALHLLLTLRENAAACQMFGNYPFNSLT